MDWTRNYPEDEVNSKRHGLCGDAANVPQEFMFGGSWYQGGTPVETYVEGEAIDIEISVSTHHHGWFEFKICDNSDGGPITQSCLNEHVLVRDPSDPSISPIDQKYPSRYYMIPKCHPESMKQSMRYLLPPGLTCEHCVLQWYWVTANSCHGGGYEGVAFPETFVKNGKEVRYDDKTACPDGDGGAVGWYPRLPLESSKCREGKGYPEEFWNCADIRILAGDGSVVTRSPTPQTTPAPTATQTPAPTVAPGSCAALWGQCGGDGWSGPRCCQTGSVCQVGNRWYHQCVPDGGEGGGGGGDGGGETPEPDNCGADDSLGAVSSRGFADDHGKLTLDGVQLVDEFGAPVQLVGMSSHGLHWFPKCYTKESIQFLVENWGINVFRAAMYIGEGGYGDMGPSARAKLLEKLENIVDWCEELGIYVIIDWHVLTPGDPNAWLDSRGASSGLAIDFWEYVANKYKNKKHVLYETANEPNNVQWDTVKAYHDAVIKAIRRIDSETIILAGTTTWSQDIHLAAKNPVTQPYNVMYAFHFYAGTHESLLKRVATYADQIPLFSTEWGTSQASGDNGPNLGVTKKFLDLFAEKGISWAQWSYADKAETSAALASGACTSRNWDQTSCSGTFVKNYIKKAILEQQEKATPSPTTVTLPPSQSPTDQVTNAPSTKAPTTKSPTAKAPTTKSPTTKAPTTKSPTTKAPTTKSPIGAPEPSECSILWKQCGGKNWKGPKCCASGSICSKSNKWYSQCIPDPNKTCRNVYEKCSEEKPCCSSYKCVAQNKWYSQCVAKELPRKGRFHGLLRT